MPLTRIAQNSIARLIHLALFEIGFPAAAITNKRQIDNTTLVEVPQFESLGSDANDTTDYVARQSANAKKEVLTLTERLTKAKLSPSEVNDGWGLGDFMPEMKDALAKQIVGDIMAAFKDIPTNQLVELPAIADFDGSSILELSGKIKGMNPVLMLNPEYYAKTGRVTTENLDGGSPNVWGMSNIYRCNMDFPTVDGKQLVGVLLPRRGIFSASSKNSIFAEGQRYEDISIPGIGMSVRLVQFAEPASNTHQISIRVNFGAHLYKSLDVLGLYAPVTTISDGGGAPVAPISEPVAPASEPVAKASTPTK